MNAQTIAVFLELLVFCFGDLSDVGLTTPEIIENHDYPAETHKITTEDGYILTLHRIPYGAGGDGTEKRPAVFMMHGMTSSSADFVNMGPGRSLGYILADEGYDVWLGNARGNGYSREHVSLDVVEDAAQFFNFSWHEIGYYDVAASIDYILEKNGDEALHYVGHSQGCAVFFVTASTRPEYNDKIKMASLMAPAAFVEHRPLTLINSFAKHIDQVESLFQKYKIYEIPYLEDLRQFAQTKCLLPENLDFCVALFTAVGGSISNGQIETDMIPVISTNSPSNTAIKQLIHFGQLVKYGGFTWFNYGADKNLQLYGKETPPDYDLSKVSAPVAIYYSKDDTAVPYIDVLNLIDHLPNIADNYVVPYPTFNHIDFIFAKDIVSLLYNKLVSVMQSTN